MNVVDLENTKTSIKVSAHAERDTTCRQISPFNVINDRTIKVVAVALDDTKRLFSNASYLSVSWKLVGCKDLAQWAVEKPDANVVASGWERILALGNGVGEV